MDSNTLAKHTLGILKNLRAESKDMAQGLKFRDAFKRQVLLKHQTNINSLIANLEQELKK